LGWRIEIHRTAEQQISKLDPQTQLQVIQYLRERIEGGSDPRRVGKALRGEKRGLWRYRVHDYRLICDIRDAEHTVAVLTVAHRKDAYR